MFDLINAGEGMRILPVFADLFILEPNARNAKERLQTDLCLSAKVFVA
jgi:hypothetical protein